MSLEVLVKRTKKMSNLAKADLFLTENTNGKEFWEILKKTYIFLVVISSA